MKLFNRKPKDKIKVATAFTLKGLTKQVIRLEQKGFIKQGEIEQQSNLECLELLTIKEWLDYV